MLPNGTRGAADRKKSPVHRPFAHVPFDQLRVPTVGNALRPLRSFHEVASALQSCDWCLYRARVDKLESEMGLRLFASAGLLVAAAPAIVWAQSGSDDAGRNWAAVAACAAVDSAEQRHQCVDDVLRRAGLLSAERVAEAARQEFGRDGRAEAPRGAERRQESAPAPAAPAAAAVAAAPTRPADIDEVATTVASVRTVGYRRLVVTTAEGSVWQQTEAESFTTTPKAGDPFVIQRAAFNSYRCRFGNSSRYRCERVD